MQCELRDAALYMFRGTPKIQRKMALYLLLIADVAPDKQDQHFSHTRWRFADGVCEQWHTALISISASDMAVCTHSGTSPSG